VVYVYSAPLALATAFRSFTAYWNIMARTIGGSMLLALAFFGINQTASDLEDPLGHDANDLPLDNMGAALKNELNGLFSEPIPALKLPAERPEKGEGEKRA